MKIFPLAVAGALALSAVRGPPAAAQPIAGPPVYRGCAPAPKAFRRALWVDPGARHSGSGDATEPYAQLTQALAAARPGDVIYLKSGSYGDVTIGGQNVEFVTLAAAPGAAPVLHSLQVRGAARWRFSGLQILGPAAGTLGGDGWQIHPPKVVIADSRDIIFDKNTVATTLDAYDWKPEVRGARVAESLAGGVSATQVSCLAVDGNKIINIWVGLDVGGDQSGDRGKNILVQGNLIDHFAGDGIDHQASNLLIKWNEITNAHDLCNNVCIHHDAIQGWNWLNRPGLVDANVVIDSNFIVLPAKPDLVMPAGDVQGITIFDGGWDGLEIANNVVVSPAWHAVSVYGVQNAKIINNTVLCANPDRNCWIMVTKRKGDSDQTVYNVTVRNNIAASLMIGDHGAAVRGVKADHNVLTDDPGRIVARFDPRHAAYDLHLRPGSPARGAGAAEFAPGVDIEGHPRAGKIDAGAYAAAQAKP